jgi:chromosome segregation ATPase
MQLRILASGVAVVAMLLSSSASFAQSETDKLRDALRDAMAQQHSLEDQRVALQTQLADAAREKANLKAQVDAAQAEIKKVKEQYRQAVNEFNKRLGERDDALEKWKSAYDEAASVARTKDAERAKFEAQAAALDASYKSCRGKNTELVKLDRDLTRRYASVTFVDKILAREPVTGLKRVQVQNELQDYTDKILNQKETACAK